MNTLKNCKILLWLAVVAVLAFAVVANAAPPDRQGAAPFPHGKPVAPISIDYALGGTPALGRPITVRVTIVPELRLDNTVVTLTPDAALVLDKDPLRTAHGSVAAGNAVELEFSATPLALERMSLRVLVEGDIEGVHQVRTLSIPFRLGPPRPRSAPELETDARGELLRVMPAQRPSRGGFL